MFKVPFKEASSGRKIFPAPLPMEGLPAYYWKLNNSKLGLTDISPRALNLDDCLDYLYNYAKEHSSHPVYPSAGMLLGQNEHTGETVIIVAANVIPPRLVERGVTASKKFLGSNRAEGPTVHFEHLLYEAAARFQLDNVTLIGSDQMCPNCANYARVFGVDHYVYDKASFDRPIYKDRISDNDSHNRQSIPLLRLSGASVSKYDRNTKHLETLEPLAGRYPVQSCSYFFPNKEMLNKLLHSVSHDPVAVLSYTTDNGQIAAHILEADSNVQTDLEKAIYNGHRVGDLDPLMKLLTYTARLGIDPRKCDIAVSYPVDVNPALLLSLAGPKSFQSFASEPMSAGARQILEMSGLLRDSPVAVPGLNVA